jgi:hypothetical protein
MAVQSDWRNGPPPQNIRDLLRAKGQARDAELKAKPYTGQTKSVFGREGSLAKAADKGLQRRINEAVAERAPKGSTLRANLDSDCFESVVWRDGVATATFWRGGAIVYDYDVSREEFIDWVSSGSLGGYFNDNIRE